MQYLLLHEAWKKEKENNDLQALPRSFYSEATALVRSQKEEVQLLDEKSLHAKLLLKQQARTQKILAELIESRFQKIYRSVLNSKPLSLDSLTSEEEEIAKGLLSLRDGFDSLSESVLQGRSYHIEKVSTSDLSRPILVRFLQDMPSIVGPDARIYGPFKAEDITTLPIENAESLIKRGVALRVEVE